MRTFLNLLVSYSGKYHADDFACVVLCTTVALMTGEFTTACNIGIDYCFSKLY
jgi:hypothetical protein